MRPPKGSISYILLLTGIFFLFQGCSHKVLTVFFDDVPEMNDSLKLAVKPDPPKPDSALRQQPLLLASASKRSHHTAFTKKKCETCHLPGNDNELNLSQPELCYKCHPVYKFTFEHGPVASGFCTTCHDPHKVNNPKLLLAVGQELCLKCHDQSGLGKSREHRDMGSLPCTKCHNPHGGNKKYFLNQD